MSSGHCSVAEPDVYAIISDIAVLQFIRLLCLISKAEGSFATVSRITVGPVQDSPVPKSHLSILLFPYASLEIGG